MSVLQRSELEASPLADLHAIAAQLGLDGFRRLRKAALIDAILGEESPEEPAAADEEEGDRPPRSRGTRSRRGGRGRRGTPRDGEGDADADADRDGGGGEAASDDDAEPARERRSARPSAEERVAEGVVELLGNGSAFLRVDPPEPSDEDIYISAAQVRRCELVSGDRVSGPVRNPRRSERYPSLVRVDTINGAPAEAVAEGTPYDDLPAAFPSERLALGGEDPTVKAIEWLTPLGRGSRATITGPTRAGKTEALRRLAAALAGQEGLDLVVVLAGVRPEEVADWRGLGVEPAVVVSMAGSPESQAQAVERAIESARRIAARGGHAVVLVDGLDAVPAGQARRLLAAARNIADGGSLTIVATAPEPVGGETTVIALDRALTSTGRLPALDLRASGTLRPELLVGESGAEAIAQARAAAGE